MAATEDQTGQTARDTPHRRHTDSHDDDSTARPSEHGKDADRDGTQDEQPQKKPSPLSKPWVRVLLVVIVVAALIAGGIWFFHWWTHGRFVQETNNAYLQADQVTVMAKVSGTVERVLVADNQQVHAGDLLVQIDDRASRARVDQALAGAAQARASIAQTEAQMAEQNAAIAQARAALGGARAQLAYAESEVQRYAPMAVSGAEPREKFAQLVANRDQALAGARQNDAGLAQAQRRVAALKAQIAVSTAQVAQADAQARQAQVDLESSQVRAPIDGRVADRQVRLGMAAEVGARLLTIVPVQSLYLVANFKETQIGLMRVGQPATITVDALGGTEISGTVDSFSPGTGASFALIPANNATGNFTKIVQRVPVRIRLDPGPEASKVLVPGLSVEVSVDTLGNKQEGRRRDEEEKRTEDVRNQAREQGVQANRDQPASGAGR